MSDTQAVVPWSTTKSTGIVWSANRHGLPQVTNIDIPAHHIIYTANSEDVPTRIGRPLILAKWGPPNQLSVYTRLNILALDSERGLVRNDWVYHDTATCVALPNQENLSEKYVMEAVGFCYAKRDHYFHTRLHLPANHTTFEQFKISFDLVGSNALYDYVAASAHMRWKPTVDLLRYLFPGMFPVLLQQPSQSHPSQQDATATRSEPVWYLPQFPDIHHLYELQEVDPLGYAPAHPQQTTRQSSSGHRQAPQQQHGQPRRQ